MQTRKFFLIGMAALLSASLFLIGCGDSEADSNTVYDKSGVVYGAVTTAELQEAIDDTVAEGRALELKGVTVSDDGVVNLSTASVKISGTLTPSANTVVNAAAATVTFADGAVITGAATNIIVCDPAIFIPVRVTGGAKVAEPVAADALPETVSDGDVAAVENLTLSGTARDIAANLTVYVYGTLTADGDSAARRNC
ncbi:MAG: hypothetical protein LBG27_00860 [Spirochaetaceae bacterium]|jgi:hypothetical protein|nr:hypothetical protein [Spirochaetaceae bacterium]